MIWIRAQGENSLTIPNGISGSSGEACQSQSYTLGDFSPSSQPEACAVAHPSVPPQIVCGPDSQTNQPTLGPSLSTEPKPHIKAAAVALKTWAWWEDGGRVLKRPLKAERMVFLQKNLLVNCQNKQQHCSPGRRGPGPLVNGHCVCPATDTCVFVGERRPGHDINTVQASLCADTIAGPPATVGNQHKISLRRFSLNPTPMHCLWKQGY